MIKEEITFRKSKNQDTLELGFKDEADNITDNPFFDIDIYHGQTNVIYQVKNESDKDVYIEPQNILLNSNEYEKTTEHVKYYHGKFSYLEENVKPDLPKGAQETFYIPPNKKIKIKPELQPDFITWLKEKNLENPQENFTVTFRFLLRAGKETYHLVSQPERIRQDIRTKIEFSPGKESREWSFENYNDVSSVEDHLETGDYLGNMTYSVKNKSDKHLLIEVGRTLLSGEKYPVGDETILFCDYNLRTYGQKYVDITDEELFRRYYHVGPNKTFTLYISMDWDAIDYIYGEIERWVQHVFRFHIDDKSYIVKTKKLCV